MSYSNPNPWLMVLGAMAGVFFARWLLSLQPAKSQSVAHVKRPGLWLGLLDTYWLLMLVAASLLAAPFMFKQNAVKFDYRSDYATWVPDMILALTPMILIMAVALISHRQMAGHPDLTTRQRLSIAATMLAAAALGGLLFVWAMQLDIISGQRMGYDMGWYYLHYGIGQLVLFGGFYVAVRIARSKRAFFRPQGINYLGALPAS